MRSRSFVALSSVVMVMTGVFLATDRLAGQGAQTSPGGEEVASSVPRTADGHPDLTGIWGRKMAPPQDTNPNSTRDRRGGAAITDLARAYNEVWSERGAPGQRPSRVVDPPDGRVPALTQEALDRRLAWQKRTGKVGARTEGRQLRYGSTSPDGTTDGFEGGADGRGVRADGPEDRNFAERCITGRFGGGGFRRIVLGPDSMSEYREQVGGIAIRAIPITSRTHLPGNVRLWLGDSRARWEGDTLVVDSTNFMENYDAAPSWSGKNLHLIERYTRIDADTLEYGVTYDDPSTWEGSWTRVSYMTKQSDEENRIFEYACHEGNYGMTYLLKSTRAEEKAEAEKHK